MPKQGFLVTNIGIFVFSSNFAIILIRRCWFQIWQYCFQIPVRKFPNKAFLVPNLGIFVFSQNLQLAKFDGADFKYDDTVFKILAQKYLFSNSSPKITK